MYKTHYLRFLGLDDPFKVYSVCNTKKFLDIRTLKTYKDNQKCLHCLKILKPYSWEIEYYEQLQIRKKKRLDKDLRRLLK